MRFSPEFIEKVREANNIVDVISQHVQLQKAGSSLRGLCPFPSHAEKTPSFYVSEVKQLYHCFGCKKAGSVISFLMDYQGLSFPETIEYLAQRSNIALPEPEKGVSRDPREPADQNKLYFKLNKYVGSYFQKNLAASPSGNPVQAYLKSRGLNPEVVDEFKLGYALPGWSELTSALERGRAPLGAAEKLGLIKKKQDGRYFDLFRDRLIFPIISANGNVVGFGGRVVPAGSEEQQPKYLNSPESPVFNKGRTLYGLHATAKYIRSANEVFVVEGYMDLMALFQFGIKNVVATLGTAFTFEHAKSLQRLCSKAVVVFDSDDAGRIAADKSLLLFLESGLFSRCLILSGAKDPDEFLRKFGVEEFRIQAERAPDHFLAFLGHKMAQFKGMPTEKMEIIEVLKGPLNRVRDNNLRTLYLAEVADRLGVQVPWIARQLAAPASQVIENTDKKSRIIDPPDIPRDELILVQFMLENAEYLRLIESSGAIENFVSDEARMLALGIAEKYCQNPNDFDKLATSLLNENKYSSELLTGHIAFNALNGDLDEAGERQLMQDCLSRVKSRKLKMRSKEIINSMKSGDGSSKDELESFMRIAREQKGPKDTAQ